MTKTQNLESLYIDLMKKTVSFLLWPEPLLSIANYKSAKKPIKKHITDIAEALKIDHTNLHIAYERLFEMPNRTNGEIWPGYADTMIGLKRLDNLQYCIETVLEEDIQGDLIETGVWRGGATIFMRAVLAAYNITNRKVFVADSFEGLPKPNPEKYPQDKGDTFHLYKYLSNSLNVVKNNFKKYNLLDDNVVFLKGWFKDTLPKAPIKKLSVLRLDGDMYESTIVALDALYPKLSKGGFCIIDDYALTPCKKAVDDFRNAHAINAHISEIDWTGIFWRNE